MQFPILTEFTMLSVIALLVALVCFAAAHFGFLCDRARLRITTKLYPGSPNLGPAHLVIGMINVGRRPLVLRSIGGPNNVGEWSGALLGLENEGIRLAENERYDYTLEKPDTMYRRADKEIEFETLWVEDSQGVRHKVPDSAALIKRLREQEQ
jgi:hypothetical protein